MMSNIGFLYEQLRQAIDGGSESMTHDDALDQIAYWRDQCSLIQSQQEPVVDCPRCGHCCPQRKPLTDEKVNECGICGYVGKDKDKTGQCPKCRWDELRPFTGKAHQKPLTDDQIYEMYNEPRSDAEMLEFARAIEAAHGIGEKK